MTATDNFFDQFDDGLKPSSETPGAATNFFDQFDDVSKPRSSTPAPAVNVFDQFDDAPQPDPAGAATEPDAAVNFFDQFDAGGAPLAKAGDDAFEKGVAEAAEKATVLGALTDPQQYKETAKGIVPGAISMGGTTLGGLSGWNVNQLIREAYQPFIGSLKRVPQMTEPEFAAFLDHLHQKDAAPRLTWAARQLRSGQMTVPQVDEEFPAPVPMKDRTLYAAGQSVKEFADELLPAAAGYEESAGRMVGEGLGSLAAGLAASMAGGPAAGGALFAAAGTGEALDRAIKFDNSERMWGRKGLTPDQITTAGLYGVAPGATDLIPIETMLGRFSWLPQSVRRPLAQGIARIGGQAFIEGVQEGGQQFLQNFIAQGVYNPQQDLGEDVPINTAVGGGVGALAQAGREALGLMGTRRGHHAAPVPDQPDPAGSATPTVREAKLRSRDGAAPVSEPPGPAPAPAPQAPVGTVDDTAILKSLGYSDEDLADMDAEEIRAEAADARDNFRLPELADDMPSAEPIGDLLAQARDLADPKNTRRGLWLSPANLTALGRDAAAAREIGAAGELIDDFDGEGGALLVKDRDTAERARMARDVALRLQDPAQRNAAMQIILGELTGAGVGKPAAAAAVVQQVTGDGAVTRERVVATGDEAEDAEAEFEAAGRGVRTVTPEVALARREVGDGTSARTYPTRGYGSVTADEAASLLRAVENAIESVGVDQLDAIDARLDWLRGGAVGDDPVVGGKAWEGVRDKIESYIPGARQGRLDERIRRLEDKRRRIIRDRDGVLPTLEERRRELQAIVGGGVPVHEAKGAAYVVQNDSEAAGRGVRTVTPEVALARREAGALAPPPPAATAFRTAKGSTYVVQEDGTTVRDKAARDDFGHEGDSGLKPASQATYYVSAQDAARLALPETGSPRIVDHGDGTLSVASKGAGGRWGISPLSRNVPVTSRPTVGAIPVELWKRETINGLPGYGTVHFGNEIVEVGEAPAGGDGSRAAPVAVASGEDLARAAARVAEPTDAQKDAGNYRKGHVDYQGLKVSIETPKGGVRSGTGPDGRAWQVAMPAHYGYVKGTLGRDGDQVDVYLGESPQSERVWVVDQVDRETGRFDEHKAMLGFTSRDAALETYRAAFSDGAGSERIGGVTEMGFAEFREWLGKGKRARPLSKLSGKRAAPGDAATSLVMINDKAARLHSWDDNGIWRGGASTTGQKSIDAETSEPTRGLERGVAKARAHVLRLGRQHNREYGAMVLPDGTMKANRAPTRSRTDSFLLVSQDTAPELWTGAPRSVDFHHNHPRSSSFSRADYTEAAIRPALRRTWVHAHDGSEYWAELLADSDTLGAAYDLAHEATHVLDGDTTLPRYRTHLVALMLEDAGLIRYHADLAPANADEDVEALVETLQNDDLWPSTVSEMRGLREEGDDVLDQRAGSDGAAQDVAASSRRSEPARAEPARSETRDDDGETDDRREGARGQQTSRGPRYADASLSDDEIETLIEAWRYLGEVETRRMAGEDLTDDEIATANELEAELWDLGVPDDVSAEADLRELLGARAAPARQGPADQDKDRPEGRDRGRDRPAPDEPADARAAQSRGLRDDKAPETGPSLSEGPEAETEPASPEDDQRSFDELSPEEKIDWYVQEIEGARDYPHSRAIIQNLALQTRLRYIGFDSIIDARKFLARIGITGSPKELDEQIETAVVRVASEIVNEDRHEGRSPNATYHALVDLYGKQPNLSARTGTSVANQAYSTPVPLAFLASRLARVTEAKSVYEPAAGNGALLIETDSTEQDVHANEIDPARAQELRDYDYEVTTQDGAGKPPVSRVDVVIMNPPFGAVREGGESKSWTVDGLGTTQIDHAMALAGLGAMGDEGRGVLILGGVNAEDVRERRKGYRGKAKREFFAKLYKSYNVTDHFTVSGDLYARQGAGWPVDVVVINGRGPSQMTLPAAEPPRIYKSWQDLEEKLGDDPQRYRSPQSRSPGKAAEARGSGVPDGATDQGIRRPVRGDAGGVGDVHGRGAVGLLSGQQDETGRLRRGSDRRQPDHVRAHRRGDPGVQAEVVRERERDREHARDVGRVGPRLERAQRKTAGGQTAYEPVSAQPSLSLLVPASMADASRAALEAVAERHGSIDDFVADRLDMPVGDLGRRFSAEQVDAIAAAIDNIERGSALVLGDQTGAGKGRVVAAVLLYAHRRGMVPVLFTQDAGLYGDMFRDLRDIGVPELLGRDMNLLMTNADERVPLDEEALNWKAESEAARESGGRVPPRRGRWLMTRGGPRHTQAMRGIIEGKGDYDFVFTSYDQMNAKTSDRRKFLEAIAPRALIVLDESHNAGGTAKGRVSKTAPLDRAAFARQLVKNAKAVMYSSATYAKRPDVMDLYARTDMGQAVADPKLLPELIQRGGVPMQQIVASMLSRSGQYLRRERSFEGVSYEVEGAEVDQDSYRQFSEAVQAVFQFDLAVKDVREEMLQAELDRMGAAKARDGSVGEAGAQSTTFASVMHNLVAQMLLAIKANAVADRAIAAHKAGEKPVIGLSNTMETFVRDFAIAEGIPIGGEINLTFSDVLSRYLARTLRVTVRDADGKVEHKTISVGKLPTYLQRLYRDALDAINAGDYEGLPVSPIDWMRHRMAKAGLRVGEVTGRQNLVDYDQSPPRYVLRPKREQGAAGKRSTIAAFNAGRVHAVILNKSGATGVSLHASRDFKDQRRRRLILAQADANIDTHLQMLGRIHRTGQVITPAYSQIAAEVPAEARPAAVLMGKMASLNANTTGARKSVFTAESVDFLNEVGDKVVAEIVTEEGNLNARLGGALKVEDDGALAEEGAARRVTGRLVLLTPSEQTELLDRIQKAYKAEIERLDATGENALEAKTLDLAARKLDETVVRESVGEGPFRDAVRIEKVSVKAQGRALKPSAVADAIAETIGEPKSEEDPVERLDALVAKGRAWADVKRRDVEKRAQDWLAADVAATGDDARAATEKRHVETLRRWRQTMDVAAPGARVVLSLPAGDMPGIVTKVERSGKAKNPVALGSWSVTIAVPDSSRLLTFPMSKLFPAGAVKGDDESGAAIAARRGSTAELLAAFEEARKEGRENRFMVTGNILAGYEQVRGRGQIVNYTTEDGEVRPGVLLGRDFALEKFLDKRSVRLVSGRQVDAFLSRAPGAEVKSTDGHVALRLERDGLTIDTAASRATGGRYFTDPKVMEAVHPKEFELIRSKGVMRASGIATSRIANVVDALRRAGALFETTQAQDVAQAVTKELPVDAALSAGGGHGALTVDHIATFLKMGRTVRIPEPVVRATLDAMAPHLGLLPKGTAAAVVARLVPKPKGSRYDTTVVLLDETGAEHELVINWSDLATTRAFTRTDGRLIGLFRLSPPELGPQADRSGPAFGGQAGGGIGQIAAGQQVVVDASGLIGAQVHGNDGISVEIRALLVHEAIHARRRLGLLSGTVWGRLVAHAKKLRILVKEWGTYLAEIRHPDAERTAGGTTVRDVYEAKYAGQPDFQERMDQESVAILAELIVHGQVLPAEIAPIADDLRRAFRRGSKTDSRRSAAEDDPVDAALSGASADIIKVMAARQRAIVALIRRGQAYDVRPEVVTASLDALRAGLQDVTLPAGTPVGAMSRIDPYRDPAGRFDVMVTFVGLDGETYENPFELAPLLRARAFRDRRNGGVFTARLAVPDAVLHQAPEALAVETDVKFRHDGKRLVGKGEGDLFAAGPFAQAIAGEIRHEFVHVIWSRLSAATRRLLFAHAQSLRVLDMQFGTYLQMVGHPSTTDDTTLREAYRNLYRGQPDFTDRMRQEAVAHMVEGAHHGFWVLPAEVWDALGLSPAQPSRSQAAASAGDMMFALAAGGARPRRTNATGHVLALPFEAEWGDPRFDSDDRARALMRLGEIAQINVAKAPWAELVQARDDIRQIMASLYYYPPDESGPEIRDRNDDVTIYLLELIDIERGLLKGQDAHTVMAITSDNILAQTPAEKRAKLADVVAFGAAGREAIVHLLDSPRKGVLDLVRWNDREEPAQAKPRPPRVLQPGRIGETQRSGFYWLSGRLMGQTPDAVLRQGGQAVIDWLRQAGVSRAEVDHLQLQDLVRPGPASRDDFRRRIAERMFDFKAKTVFFNPERSPLDYEQGGTRAFSGPRIPGRGVYFEHTIAFPKRLRGGEEFPPGSFEGPHWSDPGIWASVRGTIREVDGWGSMMLAEEAQSDYVQGMLGKTPRRPKITSAEIRERKKTSKRYHEVVGNARQLARLGIRRGHGAGDAGAQQRSILAERVVPARGWEYSLDTWIEFVEAARQLNRQQFGKPGSDSREIVRSLEALDDLVLLRQANERFFAPGGFEAYGEIGNSRTPEQPLGERYQRAMVRDIILLAAKKGVHTIGLATSETTQRIQANTQHSAAHFYDAGLARSLMKEMRRLTGDDKLALTRIALPKALGAPRNEKPYTVWAVRLPKDVRQKLLADDSGGLPMFSMVPGAAPSNASAVGFHTANVVKEVESRLKKGEASIIAPAEVRFGLLSIQPDIDLAPKGTVVAGLSKIEPDVVHDGHVLATFMTPQGKPATIRLPWKRLRGSGAIFVAGRRPAILLVHFGEALHASDVVLEVNDPRVKAASVIDEVSEVRLRLADQFRADFRHELVHLLRSTGALSGSRWRRLVDHANSLDLLGLDVTVPAPQRVLSRMAGNQPLRTLRDAYAEMYARYDNPQELFDQESVAALVELAWLGSLSDAEIAPVRDILDGIAKGNVIARRPSAPGSGPLFSLRSPGDTPLASPPRGAGKLEREIADAVNIVARISGTEVDVVLRDTIGGGIASLEQKRAARALGATGATAGGFYQRPRVDGRALIGLATKDPQYDLRTAAGHEAWHHVEETLATEAERRLLRYPDEVARMRKVYVAPELGFAPADPRLALLPDTETRAIAFQRYRRQREEGAEEVRGLHIGVRRFFDRLLRILANVRNWMKGRGYGSAEDIFERARQGEMAGRNAQGGPAATQATNIPESRTEAAEANLRAMLDRYEAEARRLDADGVTKTEAARRLAALWTKLSADKAIEYSNRRPETEGRDEGPLVDEAALEHMLDVASADESALKTRRRQSSRFIAAVRQDGPARYDLIGTSTPDARLWTPELYRDIESVIQSGTHTLPSLTTELSRRQGRPFTVSQVSAAVQRMAANKTMIRLVMEQRGSRDASTLNKDDLRRPTDAQSRNHILRGALRDLSEGGETFRSRQEIADALTEMTGIDALTAADVTNAAKGGDVARPGLTKATSKGYRLHPDILLAARAFIDKASDSAPVTVPAMGSALRAAGHEVSDATLYASPDVRMLRESFLARSGRHTARGAASQEIDRRLAGDLRTASAKHAAEALRRDGHSTVTEALVEKYRTRLMRAGTIPSLRFRWTPAASRAALEKSAPEAAGMLGTTTSAVNNHRAQLRQMPLADLAIHLGVTEDMAADMLAKPARLRDEANRSRSASGDGEPPVMALNIPTAAGGARTAVPRWRLWAEQRVERMRRATDRARIKIQDRALPIRRVAVERVERETSTTVPVHLDTYVAEALYHGRAGERLVDLETDWVEPITERLREAGISAEELGDYLYARHARERNAKVGALHSEGSDFRRAISEDDIVGASGVSNAWADGVLDGVRTGGKQADYTVLADMIDRMQQEARDTLLRAGLVDRETYEEWRDQYKHYVPLRGYDVGEEENPDRPRTGRGFDVRGPEAMQALGRRSKADNPLVYAVMQASQAIVRAEKNRVAKTLLRAVKAYPNDAVWSVTKGESRRRVNPETGLVETYWVPPAFVRAENLYVAKVGGKQQWIEIKNADLARAMRSSTLDVGGTWIGQAFLSLTRAYAKLLTAWNPEFVVSNFFRDAETALLNVTDVKEKPQGTRRQIVKDALSIKSIRGIMAALNSEDGRTIFGASRSANETWLGTQRSAGATDMARWFEEYRLAGGKISYLEFNDVERIRSDITRALSNGRLRRGLAAVAGLVENLNTGVENGVRLSTFVALRKAGIPAARAAFVARELTVNFNRRGEWGPGINAAYIFFNASLQGVSRLARAVGKSKELRYAIAGLFALGMAMDMLNSILGAPDDDDDERNAWDAVPQWEKESKLIVVLPEWLAGQLPDGVYPRLPLAYGYNAPFAAGINVGAMLRGKKDPAEVAAATVLSFAESFNPLGRAPNFTQMVAPTFLDPVVQVDQNVGWDGRPIAPTKFERKLPDSELYWASVPWWAREAARVLNEETGGNRARPGAVDVSPETIQHYVEFAGGGAAKFISRALNSGERLAEGDEWLPDEMPIVRVFVGRISSVSRKQDFYEAWNEVDAAHFEVVRMRKLEDFDGARAARAEHQDLLSAYPAMKNARNQLRSLKKHRDEVEADSGLADSVKRSKRDDLTKRENEVIERALKALHRKAGASHPAAELEGVTP